MENLSSNQVITWIKSFNTDETVIRLFQEEDIDGTTLVLLQQEDIVQIFPRIKDRVNFVHQRTKLIEQINEKCTDLHEITDALQHKVSSDSSVLFPIEGSQNDDPNPDMSSTINSHDNDDSHTESRLPTDYTGPILSERIQYYIDQNNPAKFNPHTTLRAEILSLLFDDVTKTHELLYPNHDEYIIMAKSIVKKLSIPSALVSEAIKDWHESIKQKFKRERRPLQTDNKLVKLKQTKYGDGKTNGRPKKRSVVAQAERRTNDIPFINLIDGQDKNLLSLANQMKTELLKDNPDSNILHNLWRQSFNMRRLQVRDLPIGEILERYPGYRCPDLLLAEVQETIGVDLNANIENLLPKLLECLPDNDRFISDVMVIRVVRILCKIFGDSAGNVFTYQEVLVPYPCIKILEQKFELYLDFHLITETNSPSTALALLLSLYYVFEIRFAYHNRCCKLLYSILFQDAHYLNKSLKHLLNSWNYKITSQPLRKRQAVVINTTECFTQPSTDNENILSPFNNLTQIDLTIHQQSEQIQCSSSSLELITSGNTDKNDLESIHSNDYEQTTDSAHENIFHHLSDISVPIHDSQLKSPMVLQNESQSSINYESFVDDFNLQKTNDISNSKSSMYSKSNELEPDESKENITPASNLKRKRKQNPPSSPSINLNRQSTRLSTKRTRVQ